jgi:hypothetical protein
LRVIKVMPTLRPRKGVELPVGRLASGLCVVLTGEASRGGSLPAGARGTGEEDAERAPPVGSDAAESRAPGVGVERPERHAGAIPPPAAVVGGSGGCTVSPLFAGTVRTGAEPVTTLFAGTNRGGVGGGRMPAPLLPLRRTSAGGAWRWLVALADVRALASPDDVRGPTVIMPTPSRILATKLDISARMLPRADGGRSPVRLSALRPWPLTERSSPEGPVPDGRRCSVGGGTIVRCRRAKLRSLNHNQFHTEV